MNPSRAWYSLCLIALSLLLLPMGTAHCQRRFPNGRPPLGQNLPRPNSPVSAPNAGQPDKAVMELLRKMVRPTVEYSGTQVTVVYGSTQQTSEQTIRGDSKGHVRIDFTSPQWVAGDVMLISPGEFHNYHKHNNTVDTANWPTEWNDQERRMFGLIRQGVVSVRQTGEEQIAGRNAAIIELRLRGNGFVQRKFWIDPETGIQLQIEKYTLRGILNSRTTMRSLAIGPEARISPLDFQPAFPGATHTPLFPAGAAPFRTLAEAQGRFPFRPLEPASLPAGFHLDGVWIFGEGNAARQGSILMRYTDGVSSFSLYQRLAPQKMPENPLPRSFVRNLQHWLKSSPQGTMHVQFIGHLSAQQAEALYNSLR